LGKFIELSSGENRNNILPAEVGMMADVTISHAHGGTAALEVALSGNRCIYFVICSKNLQDDFPSLYLSKRLIFSSQIPTSVYPFFPSLWEINADTSVIFLFLKNQIKILQN
jgi:hypothetical protein